MFYENKKSEANQRAIIRPFYFYVYETEHHSCIYFRTMISFAINDPQVSTAHRWAHVLHIGDDLAPRRLADKYHDGSIRLISSNFDNLYERNIPVIQACVIHVMKRQGSTQARSKTSMKNSRRRHECNGEGKPIGNSPEMETQHVIGQ